MRASIVRSFAPCQCSGPGTSGTSTAACWSWAISSMPLTLPSAIRYVLFSAIISSQKLQGHHQQTKTGQVRRSANSGALENEFLGRQLDNLTPVSENELNYLLQSSE